MHNFVQTRSKIRWPVSGEAKKYKGLLIDHETVERLQMWTTTESEGPTPLSTNSDDEGLTDIILDGEEEDDDDGGGAFTGSSPEEDWTKAMKGITFSATCIESSETIPEKDKHVDHQTSRRNE